MPPITALPHAVARLRTARLARASKPFLARGGPSGERCAGCRLVPSHCLCALLPDVPSRAGVCLIMCDIEPLKPSNTGWLIADVVESTFAFGWARTEVDPALLALLADPQWQPYLVFPGEFVAPERVVTQLIERNAEPRNAEPQFPAGPPQGEFAPTGGSDPSSGGAWGPQFPAGPPQGEFAPTGGSDPSSGGAWGPQFPAGPPRGEFAPTGGSDPSSGGAWGSASKRPLFVLLDATWPEARKMFRKSPYLNHLPVLSLQSEQLSTYRLRRSRREDHFCTSEVAALCLALAGETLAAQTLHAYLDVFTTHYLQAKHQLPVDPHSAAHQRLRALRIPPSMAHQA
jgi:DTW domain-containing protein YfiP